MGVAGVLGGALLSDSWRCSRNTLFEDVMLQPPSVPSAQLGRKNHQWSAPAGFWSQIFWDSLLQQALAALLHAVCASHGLVDERHGRDRFSTQPALTTLLILQGGRDQFETFTRILNEGISGG